MKPKSKRSELASGKARVPRWAWLGGAIVLAGVFLVTSTSWEVYHTTSPQHVAAELFGNGVSRFGRPLGISLHVALRKFYSILAFAVVGIAVSKALGARPHRLTSAALIVAIFSATIEVSQYMHGIREGVVSNVADVLCGAVGGWLGTVVSARGEKSDAAA